MSEESTIPGVPRLSHLRAVTDRERPALVEAAWEATSTGFPSTTSTEGWSRLRTYYDQAEALAAAGLEE